jgi:hypothetical protein
MEELGNTLVENMNNFFFLAKPYKCFYQTWKHIVEPQKPLDETWKQIGSIERVQVKMESKLNSFIISNALKLECKSKLDAVNVYNKLFKYPKDDNLSLVVELLLIY